MNDGTFQFLINLSCLTQWYRPAGAFKWFLSGKDSWGQMLGVLGVLGVTCCQWGERAGWGYTDWRGGESRPGSGWSLPLLPPLLLPSYWQAVSQCELRILSTSPAPPPPPDPRGPPGPPASPGHSQTKYFEWKIWGNFSGEGWARSCLHLPHSPPGRKTARERSW